MSSTSYHSKLTCKTENGDNFVQHHFWGVYVLCYLICAIPLVNQTLKQCRHYAQIINAICGFSSFFPKFPLSFFDICSIWSGLVVNPERRDMLISFLSEFHTWPLLWHTLRSRKAGNLRWRGEGSRTSGAAMGPWESGRFRVRNEADF